ncbi:MAG TPA: DinB family protein [Gemmatimonadales bacterium]|nr:DinB family protein [Gemmatimonadales bacterium]
MDARIRLLLDVVEQAFTSPAWHGTPLRGTLRGLTAREALWHPAPRRHTIWDLVLHTAYWKCMVRRRLERDPAIEFPRPGANWPELPQRTDSAAWRRDRALLDQQHALLLRAIARVDPAQLGRRGWRSKWRTAQEIYGIASHDLYHAGQIQLIKRLHGG